MRNLSIAAVLGCVLVGGYFCCARCGAQIANPSALLPPTPTPIPTPTPTPAAAVLAQQLSERSEVREKAAAALQTMGTQAATALAKYITDNLPKTCDSGHVLNIEGTTKAVTILGKIGKDIAEDKDLRDALLCAGGLNGEKWLELQLRLAAIDALGEINKSRGGILEKKLSTVFAATDLVNPASFINKLTDAGNPVSAYLWRQFSSDDQKLLQDPKSALANQRDTLATGLSNILKGGSIYETQRFSAVKLSDQTKALIARNPTGQTLIRLNRFLIKEAYRGEVREGIRDLGEILEASDNLVGIGEKLFKNLAEGKTEPPSASTPQPGQTCNDFTQARDMTNPPLIAFYCNFAVLHESQSKLVKLAADVNIDPPAKKGDQPFPKLADTKTLAASLKRIEVGYSDATTKKDDSTLKLAKAWDKTTSQFKTEAAYDLLSEVRQLSEQLHLLDKTASDLDKNQSELKELIWKLRAISERGDRPPRKMVGSEISPRELIMAAVANTLNSIFSKPPEKKPGAEGAKKGETKKEEPKKDSEKKEEDKKASDQKDSDNSEVEEDETANE